MSWSLLLASSDADLAEELAALADEGSELELADRVADTEAVMPALMRHEVDVVVIDELLTSAAISDLARQITGASPQVGIILIVREQTPELLRLAIKIGAREILSPPLSLEELEAAVRAVASWTRPLREAEQGRVARGRVADGRLVAVAGAKGGVGTTTVAIQLALAALEPSGAPSVCLVDLDLQSGDLSSLLSVPARRSVIDLAGVGEEISSLHLDETLHNHRSGLRVLFAPEEGELGDEIGASEIRRIIVALRAWHDLVVMDLGAVVTEANAVAAEMANEVLVVATPDVPALRGANRLTDLWWRLEVREPEDVTVVLNRTSKKAEVQPDLVRGVVNGKLAKVDIPAHFWTIEAAANSGRPEALEGSKARRPYAELARAVGAFGSREPEPVADEDALLGRLGGERGQATVETIGLAGLILVVVLLLWEIVLVGYTYVLAGHAAREGSRALAVGEKVEPAVRDELPDPWRDDMRLDEREFSVRVRLEAPMLVPGVGGPIKIASTSGTSVEDRPLPESQQGEAGSGGES